jgi:hypothetical protein
LWDDREIEGGQKWREKINEALSKAKGAILLVSTDFLASEFIADNELPHILKQAEAEGVTLMWIAIDDCLVEATGIEPYQCLNDPAKPLMYFDPSMQSREIATICRKINDLTFKK